jgi:hypothetical protein
MSGGSDLIGAFRAYAQKALGNDFNPEKAATALNSWIKESGDALKEKVERETERAVKKLGLAKESDLHNLQEELRALRQELGLKVTARNGSTKGKGTSRRTSGSKSAKKGSSGSIKKAAATGRKKSAKSKVKKVSGRSQSSNRARNSKSGGGK